MLKELSFPKHATCDNCRHRPFKSICTTMPSEALCNGWGCKTGLPNVPQAKMLIGGFREPVIKWPEGSGEKPTAPVVIDLPASTDALDVQAYIVAESSFCKTVGTHDIGECIVDSDGNLRDNDGDAETDMETEPLICCLCEIAECDGSKVIDDCAVCDKCYKEFSE